MASHKYNSIKKDHSKSTWNDIFNVFILAIILKLSYVDKVTCGLFLYASKNDVYSCCELQTGKPQEIFT